MILSHCQQYEKASHLTVSDGAGQWNGGHQRLEQNHISRPVGRRWTLGIKFRASPVTLVRWLLVVVLLLSTLCASADARSHGRQSDQRAREEDLDQPEEILFDHRPPPIVPLGQLERWHEKRAETTVLSRPTFVSTASALPRGAATSSAATATSSTSAAPDPTDSPLPKPFDGGLGTNYTQSSCPSFLKSFLNNDTFTSCLPFSLLLQNSVSFFTASRDSKRITQTLDATCNVVFPACSSLMSAFAQDLRKDENCGQDYRRQNPLVAQAYNGLVSYEPLYHAGCEKDGKNNYCFANAILNKTSPPNSDSFVYYLPLGIPLPGASTPSCSQCQLNTLEIFNQAAGNRNQPINPIYVDAARTIDLTCGPMFANATIPGPKGANNSAARPVMSLFTGLCIVFGIFVVHSF